MAQPDIAGLLTGIGSAPIDPMRGASIRDREIALQQQGLAGLRQGIGALTGGRVDARNPLEKAKAALAGLDPNKKEDREKILQIVSKVSPERVPALREAFAKKDEEARKQGLIETQNARGMQIKEAALAEQVRGNVVAEKNQKMTRERQAVNDAIAKRRGSEADKRAEDTLQLSKETAARVVADREIALTDAQKEAYDDGLRRTLYVDAARDKGLTLLADSLLTANMPLDDAEKILFARSDAQLGGVSKSEERAMKAILNSDGFATIMEDLPTGFFSIGKRNTQLSVMLKAKQLMLRDTNLTVETALATAAKAISDLIEPKTGGGTDVPTEGTDSGPTNENGNYDASKVIID
jgi:hypothetical protein